MEKKLTYTEAQVKALTVRWKFEPCFEGEKCWCRLVSPENPIPYEDAQVDSEFDYIIGSGSVSRIFAEHIVDLHNKSLNDAKD